MWGCVKEIHPSIKPCVWWDPSCIHIHSPWSTKPGNRSTSVSGFMHQLITPLGKCCVHDGWMNASSYNCTSYLRIQRRKWFVCGNTAGTVRGIFIKKNKIKKWIQIKVSTSFSPTISQSSNILQGKVQKSIDNIKMMIFFVKHSYAVCRMCGEWTVVKLMNLMG